MRRDIYASWSFIFYNFRSTEFKREAPELLQDNKPIMQLRGVVKAFPNGTLALRGVDLDIEPGKVHGLLGANGVLQLFPV